MDTVDIDNTITSFKRNMRVKEAINFDGDLLSHEKN